MSSSYQVKRAECREWLESLAHRLFQARKQVIREQGIVAHGSLAHGYRYGNQIYILFTKNAENTWVV